MMDENSRTGEAVAGIGEIAEEVLENAKDAAKDGAVYATQVVGRLATFVQEEPWLAVAAAFFLGYAAAQLIKRMK